MLDDQNIRTALKELISRRSLKPKAIIEELRVHDGNCVADIVAIYSHMHAYEIKGERDKVKRIQAQSHYYNVSFSKVTLVTTKNHLKWATENLELFWGLILAEEKDGSVIFKYVRPASTNPKYDSKIALQTLWREELINLSRSLGLTPSKSITREKISSSIAPRLSKKKASEHIAKYVHDRISNRRDDEGDVRSKSSFKPCARTPSLC